MGPGIVTSFVKSGKEKKVTENYFRGDENFLEIEEEG